MTANSLASPEGSILTPNGWATGKVEFAGHAISVIDGRARRRYWERISRNLS